MNRARQTDRRGRSAEAAASVFLMLKGYRVLARRYRAPVGEIDIVARRGRLMAYVEVKARADAGAAADAVLARQRARIRRAAEHFLKARPDLAELDQRFDVVLIQPWSIPIHMRDAWRD